MTQMCLNNIHRSGGMLHWMDGLAWSGGHNKKHIGHNGGGKLWTTELIKKHWNISWDFWDHWNKDLYNSKQTYKDILDSRINDQVWMLFSQGLQAVPQDAFAFFQGSLDDLLQKPRHY